MCQVVPLHLSSVREAVASYRTSDGGTDRYLGASGAGEAARFVRDKMNLKQAGRRFMASQIEVAGVLMSGLFSSVMGARPGSKKFIFRLGLWCRGGVGNAGNFGTPPTLGITPRSGIGRAATS